MRALTATGRAVLAGSAALYLAGVALGWPELLGLGAAGLVLVILSWLLVAVRPRIELSRTVEPDRVTGGQQALGQLRVHSRGRLPCPPFVVVDRVGGVPVELPVAALRPGGHRTARYALPTPRRGRLPLGPLTVERRDPLGLWRRAQPLGAEALLWVLPRTHPLPNLPVGSLFDQEGSQLETSPVGTVTFSSLRDYVPGDDPRLVHWRSTARTGQLIVRENVDTAQPTTTVVLDTRRLAYPGDAEAGLDEACEVAASVVASMRSAGRPVALHAVGEDVAAAFASGARDLPDRLAALTLSESQDDDALALLTERAASGGALVVVTGPVSPGGLARLAGLRRRFAPVVVVRLEPGVRAGAERVAGLTVVRAPGAASAATAWRSLTGGGRS